MQYHGEDFFFFEPKYHGEDELAKTQCWDPKLTMYQCLQILLSHRAANQQSNVLGKMQGTLTLTSETEMTEMHVRFVSSETAQMLVRFE